MCIEGLTIMPLGTSPGVGAGPGCVFCSFSYAPISTFKYLQYRRNAIVSIGC